MKIYQKLISGFLIVVLLILVIGHISIITQDNLAARFQKVAGEKLPGTIALIEMETELYHSFVHATEYVSTGNLKDKKAAEEALNNLEKYKAIHKLYHTAAADTFDYLNMIDKKTNAFVNAITEYMQLKDKGGNKEELRLVRVKICRIVEDFTSSMTPSIKQHLKESRKALQATRQNILQARKLILTSSAAILFLALGISFFISHLISKPIVKLTEAATQIGKGKLDTIIKINSRDEIGKLADAFNKMVSDLQKITVSRDAFAQEVIERKQAEEKIKASLREKEALLKEIHHRVKNNLQVISSLLKLQFGYMKDKRDAEILKECQHRIKSMALVHENLYQSKDLANVNLSEYVKHLVNTLFYSYGVDTSQIKLKMEIEDVMFGIETAIPCGLIINELVSNALKHAFPEGKKGEIEIAMHLTDREEIELIISDNGIGIPLDFDLRNAQSLGLKLVNLLIEQIGGKLELDRSKGTKFKIRFRETKYKKRI